MWERLKNHSGTFVSSGDVKSNLIDWNNWHSVLYI